MPSTKRQPKLLLRTPKLWLSVVLVTTLLAGCKAELSNQEVRLMVVTTCPAMVEYSKATQQKVAAELLSLPQEAVTPELMNDYSKVRDFCRELQRRASAKK